MPEKGKLYEKKNITAYNIDGKFFFRQGKYNGKKKKIIQAQIQKGENPQEWESGQENKAIAVRRKTTKTSNCDSIQHETKKKTINGDLLKWLQT